MARMVRGSQALRMNILAIVVGVIAGLGAVVFRLAIWVFQSAFYGGDLNPGSVTFHFLRIPELFGWLRPLGPWRFVVVPALGGLIVGVIIMVTTREVSGHGVPKVLQAILARGGRIRPKIAVYKTLASSIAIGSGGSLGREGPIVQIGSAAGSYFGRFVRRKSFTRTLVAAGSAGGIAATFNAPLAGIMFALEIILAEFYLRNVVAVVLASVTATAVARPLLDFTATPGVRQFLVPVHFELRNPVVELPLYVLLGLLIAVGGWAMVKLLYGVEHVTDRFHVPFALKPAAGGLILGLSALLTGLVLHKTPLQAATWLFGVGYDTIGSSMRGELVLVVMLLLAVMKLIGFSVSVGTGSSGGVFSPALYIGAMLGGAFGVVVHSFVPGTASPGAYALVGMGGVFAAAASAPLTSALIIFELTGQYTIILPVLLVCVLGSEVAQRLLKGGTIYTQKLRDRGFTVQERRIGSIEDLSASAVMTRDVDTVSADATVAEALEIFRETSHRGLPVVESDGTVVGLVTHRDLGRILPRPGRARSGTEHAAPVETSRPVLDVALRDVRTSRARANLLSVIDVMESTDQEHVPIVNEDGTLAGIITQRDILDAYDVPPVA